MFVNVIKSAIEAIGEDGWIRLRVDQDRGWPLVAIEDSGPDLSAEARANAFTPFFSTKEQGQGIVRKKIDDHFIDPLIVPQQRQPRDA